MASDAMTAPTSARLGVDIGGTFTDAVLEIGASRYTAKVLTTDSAPDDGVISAMELVLKAGGISLAQLDLLIQGATLATNALIERKGAKTGMLTTAGFKDVLQIGMENRFDVYDLFIDLPKPLVPRRLRLPVRERIGANGRVLLPLEESDVAAAVRVFEQEEVEAIAVCLLHSYANSAHEERVGELLAKALPNVPVSLSCEVAPEIRELERFTTACANAYVQPKMASYLGRLESRLRAKGLRCPMLMMLSGGGLTTVETASKFPVRLIESGPAGGAVFAAAVAEENGFSDVLSFDMGGTTAKICLIDEGRPQTTRTFEVARVYRFKKGSGMPIRIPVIDMVEIGAGGGSIAHIDSLGQVAVGPKSAGSEPGPVSYARGGVDPAVTDADLVLGRIDPEGFAGGRFPLNRKSAADTIGADIGKPLSLDAFQAAAAIADVVEENMAAAARVHAIENGKSVSDRVLIAFGGAAPLHAAAVAQKLGMNRFLVPPAAGVGSAVGFLCAPVSYEIARSKQQVMGKVNVAEINALLSDMSRRARAVVDPAAGSSARTEIRSVSMRYLGQGHEIAVTIPTRELTESDREGIRELFDKRYREVYGRNVPGVEVEVLTWSVLVSAPSPQQPAVNATGKVASTAVKPKGRRKVFDTQAFKAIDYDIYWRPDLGPGASLNGPAIVEEDETSTVLPAGMKAQILPSGAILCEGIEVPSSEREKAPRQEEIRHGMRRGALDLQILWNRLIAICEEQAQTMIRAAFSPVVREAGDLSAGLFDLQGRMLTQAVTGTPGHINSMAAAVAHFLKKFPPQSMRQGDAFITNDPWLASGHLNDVTIVTPAFHHDRIVGFFAATVHLVDVGGRGMGPDSRDVFEEGVLIPHMPLVRAGVLNRDLFDIMRANSREPLMLEGDLLAIIAAGEAGARALVKVLDEFGESDVENIGRHILETTKTAAEAAINRLKRGTFRSKTTIDGYERSLDIAVKMTVTDGQIALDFEGTGGKSEFGINVVLAYTAAYSTYGLKCVVAPDVPSNHSSLLCFPVTAPEGCIVNARKPSPVSARHIIGHVLPDAIMGSLEQALPGETLGESGMMWNPYFRGVKGFEGEDRIWEFFAFMSGGMGARSSKDGLSAAAFPSGVKCVPVEAWETTVPLVIWRKELRPDSGGPGRYRGGLGQIIEIGSFNGEPLRFQAMFERVENPAKGRAGGKPGAPGRVTQASGKVLRTKGQQSVPVEDRLVLELPGGGGYGDPAKRDPDAIRDDIAQGLVTAEAARKDYGFG